MTRLLRSLVLLLVVGWSPAYAAEWVDWYSGGAVLNLADALVIATDTDGSAAGAWSAAVAGDLSGRQLVLQLSSGDWSAVSQVEAVLSTSGNFEEYLHAELLPLLNALPEDDWIRLGVPAGVWHATPGADPRTVNAMVLRVRGEPGSTAQVAFTQPCFLRPSGGHGFITVSFDDGRTDVYEYAFPQLEARGLAGTVYAIPEHGAS